MYAYQIVFYRSGVEVVKVSKEARKQHFLRSFKVGGGELNAQSSYRPNSVTRLVVYVYSLGHLQQ